MNQNSGRKRGFSLIELSVVLVIIGLLIGGLVIGRDIIRNSNLQSVVANINSFQNGLKLFQEKYRYLPGDFPQATTIWASGVGCAINTTSTTETCNGDGDGFISSVSAPTTANTLSNENYYAWKHLSNAGFVDVQFDRFDYGRAGSKLGDAIFTIFHTPGQSGTSGVFDGKYGTIITLGATYTNNTYPAFNEALTGTDALSIDQKIDDSRPGTGNVMTFTTQTGSPVPGCASSNVATSATYNISSANTPNCSLIFKTGY